MPISDWSSDVCSSDLVVVELKERIVPLQDDGAHAKRKLQGSAVRPTDSSRHMHQIFVFSVLLEWHRPNRRRVLKAHLPIHGCKFPAVTGTRSCESNIEQRVFHRSKLHA